MRKRDIVVFALRTLLSKIGSKGRIPVADIPSSVSRFRRGAAVYWMPGHYEKSGYGRVDHDVLQCWGRTGSTVYQCGRKMCNPRLSSCISLWRWRNTALTGRNGGDITSSSLIWALKRKLSLKQIGCNGMTMARVSSSFVGFSAHEVYPGSFHQPMDPPTWAVMFRL